MGAGNYIGRGLMYTGPTTLPVSANSRFNVPRSGVLIYDGTFLNELQANCYSGENLNASIEGVRFSATMNFHDLYSVR